MPTMQEAIGTVIALFTSPTFPLPLWLDVQIFGPEFT